MDIFAPVAQGKMFSSDEFKRLSVAGRLRLVQEHGIEVAQRVYRGFTVRLFAVNEMYVEVWSRIGLDMVEWVELMPLGRVADVYGPDIDLFP